MIFELGHSGLLLLQSQQQSWLPSISTKIRPRCRWPAKVLAWAPSPGRQHAQETGIPAAHDGASLYRAGSHRCPDSHKTNTRRLACSRWWRKRCRRSADENPGSRRITKRCADRLSSPAGAQSPAIPPLLPFRNQNNGICAVGGRRSPASRARLQSGCWFWGLWEDPWRQACCDRMQHRIGLRWRRQTVLGLLSRPVWIVQTSPAGASVIRKSDGTVLARPHSEPRFPADKPDPLRSSCGWRGIRKKKSSCPTIRAVWWIDFCPQFRVQLRTHRQRFPKRTESVVGAERPSARKTGDTDESAQDTPAKKPHITPERAGTPSNLSLVLPTGESPLEIQGRSDLAQWPREPFCLVKSEQMIIDRIRRPARAHCAHQNADQLL